jgi:hypothetical protein
MRAWWASAKASRRIPVKLARYSVEAMRVVMNSADMGRNGRHKHGGGARREDRHSATQGPRRRALE